MPSSRPSSFSRSNRSSLDAVAKTRAPARFAIWIAAMPTPPAPAWIKAVSPACRWPNSKRQSSAVPNGTGTQAASSVETLSGIFQANALGRRPALGVRAVQPHRHGAVPHGEAPDVGADRGHRAGSLVPDHVGDPGQVAPQPVERVAALDAHRLDVDQHIARAHLGVRHVLVAEHLGCPGLVVHRCFHDRTYSRIRKRFVLWTYQLEVWGSWVAIFPLAFLK